MFILSIFCPLLILSLSLIYLFNYIILLFVLYPLLYCFSFCVSLSSLFISLSSLLVVFIFPPFSIFLSSLICLPIITLSHYNSMYFPSFSSFILSNLYILLLFFIYSFPLDLPHYFSDLLSFHPSLTSSLCHSSYWLYIWNQG